MFRRFLEDCRISAECTILDIGATADRSYEASNYLEAWYPDKSAITAVGLDDVSFLEDLYPGVKFVRASGLELPFEDRSFDIVHSSAVVEHVGSFENQCRFIRECTRIARKAIFVTTPNRWFPIEFHTVLPLIHWLPKPWYRHIMSAVGMTFFADEANLNLMSHNDLKHITDAISGYKFTISSISLVGWPSNLMLIGHRIPESSLN